MDAKDFLNAGAEAIGDRAAERDKPDGERSMFAAVEAFNAIYGTELTETQGWAFMALLKLSRAAGGAYRADDYVDGAAYVALAGEAAAKVCEQLIDFPSHDALEKWQERFSASCGGGNDES